jgi:hypothetical protein
MTLLPIDSLTRCLSAAIAIALLQAAPSRSVTMRDLTVPADRLPAGCTLSPAPSVRDGNRVTSGLWAGFPANPWIGTDRQRLASIRELIDGPAALPDGPPLDTRQLAGYRLQLADGVEEGYGAVYRHADAVAMTIVHAARFAPGQQPSARRDFSHTRPSRNPGIITIGQIVALVSGDGACFQAVASHLKSLAD